MKLITQKIKIAMIKQNINQLELASKMGMAQAGLSRKFKLENYTIEDLEKISRALGVELIIEFKLPTGESI